ncbi:hypothetical protein Tco_0704066 [Tanacetum coccineum]|uniref:Uncharacterized protein n=1 Tax=Tanacetum coccineum TaxID=301880 RepID=A0ABQ4Y1L4_9ASTR
MEVLCFMAVMSNGGVGCFMAKGFYLVTKMGDGAACGDVMEVLGISTNSFLSSILLVVIVIVVIILIVVVVVAIVGVVIVVAVIGVVVVVVLSFMVVFLVQNCVSLHALLTSGSCTFATENIGISPFNQRVRPKHLPSVTIEVLPSFPACALELQTNTSEQLVSSMVALVSPGASDVDILLGKYRGLNNSEGGNIGDRVKIAGGVIGSGGGIESSEELKEVLPDVADKAEV